MKSIFFSSLLCLSLVFVGCEAEEEIVRETQDAQMRHISFEEFKTMPAAYNATKKFIRPKGGHSLQRTLVYDPLYDFYVDTDQILEVSKDGFSSITLPVYRSEPKDYDENLYLVRTPDEKYTTFLIRYNLTDEDRKVYLSGGSIEGLPGKTLIYDFNQNTVNCLPEIYSHCYYTAITVQSPIRVNEGNLDDHWPAPSTTVVYVLDHCTYTVLECYESLIGAYPFVPGEGGGPGGANPGGTPSPQPNNGFVLQPGVKPLLTPILSPPIDPCGGLGAIGNQNKINLKPDYDNWLKPQVQGVPNRGERGVNVKAPYSNGERIFVSEQVSDSSGFEVPAATGAYYFLSAHTHPDNGIPMFSFADVRVLKDLYRRARSENKGLVAMIIVVKGADGVISTYALKVRNYAMLEGAVANTLSAYTGVDDDAKEVGAMAAQSNSYNTCGGNYTAQFLSDFSNYGISLYEAMDESLSNWSKLTLAAPGSQQIISTPCY